MPNYPPVSERSWCMVPVSMTNNGVTPCAHILDNDGRCPVHDYEEAHVSKPVVNDMNTEGPAADEENFFQRAADKVSYAIGTPINITFWLILVVAWTIVFATHTVGANASFLPSWFTGTAYNFPLNLVTTVAELFIGFLVAAAANRSERNLEITLARIETLETNLQREIASNTELTQAVHDLTARIDARLTGEPK